MSKSKKIENKELEKARLCMVRIFEAQKELRVLHSDYSWRGLGNTLGDYGELIGELAYGLKKANKGSKNHDAWYGKKKVQIKTIMHSKQIGFRGDTEEIDMVLVLRINKDDALWEEVYWGSFDNFHANGATFSTRDNKSMMSVSKLSKIKKTT